jgi:hypothetical protein
MMIMMILIINTNDHDINNGERRGVKWSGVHSVPLHALPLPLHSPLHSIIAMITIKVITMITIMESGV